jgi:hypothetical protein
MRKIFNLFLLTAVFSAAAFADIRLPDQKSESKQKKSVESNMIIRLDKNASEAKLIIPANQLKQLRAALDEIGEDSDATAQFTKTQTIVSGLFLSLAFVFGGVWLVRTRQSGGKLNKGVAAGAIIFLLGSATTFVFANIGPPAQLRTISGKLFNKETFRGWDSASGKIRIETSKDTSYVELIVPDKETAEGKE